MSSEAKNQDAESLARIMVTEADRLARIVDDFLTLSRLRAPQREPIDLPPLIEEIRIMTTQRRDLPEGIQLMFVINDGCGSVLADGGQLRQVSASVSVPLDGTVAVRFTPDSHVTVPLASLRTYLYWNAVPAGSATVSFQVG